MRISPETLDARRALLAALDGFLRLALRHANIDSDWKRNEGEALSALHKKQGGK